MLIQITNPTREYNMYQFCMITDVPNEYGEFDVIGKKIYRTFDYVRLGSFKRISKWL